MNRKFKRREFAGILGGAGLFLNGSHVPPGPEPGAVFERKLTLAPDYRVVIKAPGNNHEEGYIYFSGFQRLPGNKFIAMAVIDQPDSAVGRGVKGHRGEVVLSVSADGGRNWNKVDAGLNFNQRIVGCTLFSHGKALYMFVSLYGNDGSILAARSDDAGAGWSDWTEVVRIGSAASAGGESSKKRSTTDDDANLFEGQRWISFCQNSMVVRNGFLYFAVSIVSQEMAVVSCNLADVLNPGSWRISDTVYAKVPDALSGRFFPGPSMNSLEGNIIEVNGKLRMIARQVVDRYGTSNIAAVFDIEEHNGSPKLSFTQFFPTPGAHGLCYLLYDNQSGLFWMASNLESNSQNWVTSTAGSHKGRDRRFLMLWYALDALNWFPAGCIAAAGSNKQAFNYPSMVIDGNDLAIISRTTIDDIHYNSHDADHVTFHRVRDFRSLALHIFPNP